MFVYFTISRSLCLSTPYGYIPVRYLSFGDSTLGGFLKYMIFFCMSTTMVLWSHIIIFKRSNSPLLMDRSGVIYNASILLLPLPVILLHVYLLILMM